MSHPLAGLTAGRLRSLFFPMLLLTLGMMFVLNWLAVPLETEAAPYGIISYELAGSASRSAKIIASWDDTARQLAAFSLGLDFLFLVVYSTTIGLACVWAAGVLQSLGWRLAIVGIPLAWGTWLAAALDALENVGLTIILFGGSAQFWAPIARWAALAKFAVIFAGLTYSFLGLVVYLVNRTRN